MTAQPNPYVRVYYRIIDDPKFAVVYDNDAALALWLRLLLTADAMHPSPAPLPVGTRKAPLKLLIDAQLVDVLPGHRYRVRGLVAEREHRASSARRGADARWSQSDGNATTMRQQSDSDAISEPSRTKIRNGAKTMGVEPPSTNGRSRQPTVEERLVELRERLAAEPDPDLAGGIAATIARLEGKPR